MALDPSKQQQFGTAGVEGVKKAEDARGKMGTLWAHPGFSTN